MPKEELEVGAGGLFPRVLSALSRFQFSDFFGQRFLLSNSVVLHWLVFVGGFGFVFRSCFFL